MALENLHRCILIIALIAASMVAAVPVPVPEMEASDGLEELNQTAIASGEIPTTISHRIPFECSQEDDVSGEDATVQPSDELQQQLGSLQIGLKVLRSYSSQLRQNWTVPPVNCPTPVPHNYFAIRSLHYSLVTDQHMAYWIGVFQAYADHVLDILVLLEEQELHEQIPKMQTLYTVLTAVLRNYNQALLPFYCSCSENCFTVPQLSSIMPENCNVVANVEYHLSIYQGGEVLKAQNTRYKWLLNHSISVASSAKPSEAQWVMDNIQPEDAPDYNILLAV